MRSLSFNSCRYVDLGTKFTEIHECLHFQLTRLPNFHRFNGLKDGKLQRMNEESIEPHDFKSDYEQLELNDRADWSQARANYRRLVHLWHPDKYAQRPRERNHAQQQFISLTKSYDSLKSFQRENGRLPFEPVKTRPKPEKPATAKRKKTAKKHAPARHANEDLNPSILARDEDATHDAVIKPAMTGKILWTIGGVAILLLTIITFFLLDRSANQKIIEKGREAIREAPPSEFMPSAAEIRKSESRGAFIQPTK